jgi:AcrR family transcriptional regulator
MPGAFTENEKKIIGGKLLEQGYKKFAIYGLKKTNIEELANAAGISKGAFYIFYESKEALFMDVIELAEKRFRRELLEVIDLPGPSPRARLFAVLKKALNLLETIPILKFLTGSDYDLLFRKVPAEKLQEHLASDQVFLKEMITRCQNSGIPIRVQSEEFISLLYPLILSILHKDDMGVNYFGGNLDLLVELIAAFCLGEVEIQTQKSVNFSPQAIKG